MASHRRIEFRAPVENGWTIAMTVHLPDPVPADPILLFMLPGAGYSRGYYDLPGDGFSQAGAAVANGFVCVAMDHLGVGESSLPPLERSDMAGVAAANHQGAQAAIAALREGTLAPGVAPVGPRAVVACGQSLGGFILTNMQASHRSFDGIALLGASAVQTALPVRPGLVVPPIAADATREERQAHVIAHYDWVWAFHWDDEEGRALRERDIAVGIPRRMHDEPWVSRTAPGMVGQGMVPGVLKEAGARIDVPVLLAMAERDVCQPPIEEAATFTRTNDLAVYVAPRMAHMHNFAATRGLMWTRFEQFALQVAALKAQGT